ncbi:uncharacterized protein [Littorina saxatilis]|uniref:Uncharacterized protein n=1 Tax=Littorina saxatilis TaxID=31220 RepID=A0AAN9GPC8_9CAEN
MATSMPSKLDKVKDIEKPDEYLGKIIEAFKPFLLETLRVSHLLCLLHIQEVKDVAPMVHKKENCNDFRGASKLLLDAISSSDEPGKWRMFLDALREVEDTVILSTLLEEKGREDDDWLDNQDNVKLIDWFSQDIEQHLKLEELLPMMVQKKLILEDDKKKLCGLLREGSDRYANAVVLMLMHRHTSDWYKVFLTTLYDADDHHRELAKLIDPGFCQKRIEQQKAASQAVSHDEEARSARPRPAVSTIRASGGVAPEGSTSLVVNMGGRSGAREKDMGDKSVLQTDHSDPQPSDQRAACGCRCCVQVLSEVQSLRSEVAEIKTLLQHVIKSQGPNNGIGANQNLTTTHHRQSGP